MLDVVKVKGGVVKSSSTGSLGSSQSAPLALCDGSVEGEPDSSCFVQVQALEDSFAEMKHLSMEVEAHTCNCKKRQDDGVEANFRFSLWCSVVCMVRGGG